MKKQTFVARYLGTEEAMCVWLFRFLCLRNPSQSGINLVNAFFDSKRKS